MHEVTVVSEGGRHSPAVEDIDGIEYHSFHGPLPRIRLVSQYLRKFAKSADLFVDNADVAVPWLSPMFVKIPAIAIVHQLVRDVLFDELPRPFSNIGFHMEPLVYKIYSRSKIVAVSRSTALDLMQCGIPERNISIITPGCEKPPASIDQVERKPLTIASISRLMRYKGIHLGFEAFARVLKAFPDAKLEVAGTGPYEEQLRNKTAHLGISKNVSFVGRVSDGEKSRLYRSARVFITTSRREGFGLSVLEANSEGTPAVGWRVPGSNDSILDNRTGLLAQYPDTHDFAQRLEVLIGDDIVWNRLSSNARAWATEHTWDNAALKFGRIIRESLLN